ncbi:MAG: hypothetical protein RDU30_12785 [Desulfovibrionaceae bacterium]|nr:hypothetical protein [Desulfovibrionaceae bacterium]
MQKAMILVVLAVAVTLSAVSCAQKDARMTLEDFMSLCVSDAADDCRDACDEFAGVFVVTYPTSADCRRACDKVQERLGLADVGQQCDSSLNRAGDLCAQYCDKNR